MKSTNQIIISSVLYCTYGNVLFGDEELIKGHRLASIHGLNQVGNDRSLGVASDGCYLFD